MPSWSSSSSSVACLTKLVHALCSCCEIQSKAQQVEAAWRYPLEASPDANSNTERGTQLLTVSGELTVSSELIQELRARI